MRLKTYEVTDEKGEFTVCKFAYINDAGEQENVRYDITWCPSKYDFSAKEIGLSFKSKNQARLLASLLNNNRLGEALDKLVKSGEYDEYL